jgi:pimeloyl-ACP methyl ester carboxylesterase
MSPYWILPITLGGVGVLALLTALICFLRVFYLPREAASEEIKIPDGEEYEPFREQMVAWVKQTRAMPHREVHITSHDGLRLRGKLYLFSDGAPLEILFHGYRGNAERDLSGGVARCFALGHSALIVDQRGCGESEGHIATFGILEKRDCERWARYAAEELCPNVPIILTGISMGAATVLLCAESDLPAAVVGVLADCGYTSARRIICKVIRDMRLPARLLYPFVRLGARLFGGFDPDAASPIESMKHSRLPVLFFHGLSDSFVPYSMSEENCAACVSDKKLVLTPEAGHGLCFPVDGEGYLREMHAFFDPITDEKSRKMQINV